MDLDRMTWRARARRPLLSLIVLLTLTVTAQAVGPEDTTKLDCGVNALFVLLRLEGIPVTIDRLESSLPPRHRDGYSMEELSTAAWSLGLYLEGVRFAAGDKSLSRPAIAFLKDGKGGHFVVLRPVGTTGTIVQIIDPPNAPWLVDYDRVMRAKPWTGRILIPRAPWLSRIALPILLATAGVIALMLGRFGKHLRTTATLFQMPRHR